MKAQLHAGLVLAFCVCVVGCAGTGASSDRTATAMLSGTRTVSAQDVKDAIAIGTSTKADLIATLGKTTAISFDSGFEVWVYQYAGGTVTGETAGEARPVAGMENAGSKKGDPGKTEFVVLFSPSGIVAKTRIRPPPPPGVAKGT